jgi:hypothetical protein
VRNSIDQGRFLNIFPTEPFNTKDIHKKSVKISVIFRFHRMARKIW